jgi:threonine/homoserine/homoserine lactone efflux protein
MACVLGEAAAFLAVSALVIVTPGQDTALTIRNTLGGGRRGGVFTAAGVASGQAVWSVATAAGLAAVLLASEAVFDALRLLGAAYLVFLGAQALWGAVRGHVRTAGAPSRVGPAVAFRRGLVSNLGNPKMAVFFTSLLPQFGGTSFATLLALGLVFCSMTFVWLTGYAVVVARMGDVLRRTGVARALDAALGVVLVALGLRVATEAR